ncbi:uncharacterized protein LOC109595489 [Aethina tumida]|uniref:uncharacterized protein LOC109595489 n=1 Tax=Aethina tumida TaxID=116153 RepID=UPI00096B4357|nr:uncharacterized protein LOC109595489 [Aethina tumida]
MWYEIIPAYAIITAAIAAPHGIAYLLNYLVAGNMYRRSLETKPLCMQYLRDIRIGRDAYRVRGLESIPNEDGTFDEGYEEVDEYDYTVHTEGKEQETTQETKAESEQKAGQTLKKCPEKKKA